VNTLIIGGTKGLGIETAKLLAARGENVVVTGRTDPQVEGVGFYAHDLTSKDLGKSFRSMLKTLPVVDRIIYNAGILHEAHITDFTQKQIEDMVHIGLMGLMLCVQETLKKQGKIDELVTITSTSQFTPREKESTYNAVKAGAAHFTEGISLDPRVKRCLVVAPAGMATSFYDGSGRDLADMMNPKDVAQQLVNIIDDTSKQFEFALIMRGPSRVYTHVPTHGDLIRHITAGESLDLDDVTMKEF